MYYALVKVGHGAILHTSAPNRTQALAQFSKELGYDLTEVPSGPTSDLMLDEWETGPHWIDAKIAVFRGRRKASAP